MSEKNIERFYETLYRSVFTTQRTLSYDRIMDCFLLLVDEIEKTETNEDVWYIGEFKGACLSDLIIGSYWHFSEWHEGQHSKSYQVLSALGNIFSPGLSCLEDENTGERDTYNLLNNIALSEQ